MGVSAKEQCLNSHYGGMLSSPLEVLHTSAKLEFGFYKMLEITVARRESIPLTKSPSLLRDANVFVFIVMCVALY